MKPENKRSMLRKFMDALVDALGKVVLKGLAVVSDRNINSLELIIEIDEIIGITETFSTLRKYLVELMTPYVITANFSGMPRTVREMNDYFLHAYDIPKHMLVKAFSLTGMVPCLVVVAIRNRRDHKVISDFVDVYKEKDHVPGLILFFTNSATSGIQVQTDEIKFMFRNHEMAQPIIVMEKSSLHQVCKSFYSMCQAREEDNYA